jgi:hypothetical protein
MRRGANAGLVSQLNHSLLSLNEACRLRQKARESWDYFITNKVVYEAKGDKAHPLTGAGYLEQYLTSEAWFEVLLFPLGDSYAARAILEYLNLATRTGQHGYGLAARDLDIDPVLVGVPEPVENREGVVIGIPTMCWLKVSDVRDGVRQNVSRQVPEMANAPFREVPDQREGRLIEGLAPRASKVAESEIPSDVIQRRTEIMDNITEHRAERDRRRAIGRDLIDDIVEVLRIELSSELLRVSIKESPRLPFEFVKVFARPFNFEPGACNVAVHDVYSDHERQEAEDHEGPRNPRAQAPGVPSQSQEDGKPSTRRRPKK